MGKPDHAMQRGPTAWPPQHRRVVLGRDSRPDRGIARRGMGFSPDPLLDPMIAAEAAPTEAVRCARGRDFSPDPFSGPPMIAAEAAPTVAVRRARIARNRRFPASRIGNGRYPGAPIRGQSPSWLRTCPPGVAACSGAADTAKRAGSTLSPLRPQAGSGCFPTGPSPRQPCVRRSDLKSGWGHASCAGYSCLTTGMGWSNWAPARPLRTSCNASRVGLPAP